MRNRRRKFWIDPLQTRLFLRMVLYSVVLLAGIWAAAVLGQYFYRLFERTTGSGTNMFLLSPLVLTFVLLVMVFVYDTVRFTHRVAGPIYRFRQTINAIARGEQVDLVRLRKGDLLIEMRDEFNDMLMLAMPTIAPKLLAVVGRRVRALESRQGRGMPFGV